MARLKHIKVNYSCFMNMKLIKNLLFENNKFTKFVVLMKILTLFIIFHNVPYILFFYLNPNYSK
jgi:hypothetical protein